MQRNKWFGNRAFYKMVLAIAVPMMIQNGITNFVSLLDNIMVGRLGTEAMSGVSIVNQFIFIFNLMIFGAVSAAGIFIAQYHGADDQQGIRYTFRFKLLICLLSGIACGLVFYFCQDSLIGWFLHDGSAEGNLELTLAYGKDYLKIMLFGLVPYAIAQTYGSTMRETGKTMPPMVASILAVATNCILNYILIFGKFGAPALGVRGAAIATVISRFVEMGYLVILGHTKRKDFPYFVKAYRSLYIPRHLCLQVAQKGLPLMANEVVWSLSVTMCNQAYSMRGLDAVAAQNISTTFYNLFGVIYMAVGAAIAIVVGNLLGAGKLEEAKDTARKMIVFSSCSGVALGLLLAALSPVFPLLYNTSDAVRGLATYMMLLCAVNMPFEALGHSSYFTLRTGGKIFITILMDSGFRWAITVPAAVLLSRYTGVSIHVLFAVCQSTAVLKGLIGLPILARSNWAQTLIRKEADL